MFIFQVIGLCRVSQNEEYGLSLQMPVSRVEDSKTLSACHPRRDSLGAKTPDELQTATAHREVANEIPDESGKLEERRDESEEGRVELCSLGGQRMFLFCIVSFSGNQRGGEMSMYERGYEASITTEELKRGLRSEGSMWPSLFWEGGRGGVCCG